MLHYWSQRFKIIGDAASHLIFTLFPGFDIEAMDLSSPLLMNSLEVQIHAEI